MPTTNLGINYIDGNLRQPEVPINDALDVLDAAVGALQSPPSVHVYHSVNQAVAAAGTILAFDSERFDTDNIHDNSTNNSRLTCQTAGKYEPFFNIRFAVGTGTYREIDVLLNGSIVIGSIIVPPVSGVVTVLAARTPEVELAVNDYLELKAYHDHSSSLSAEAAASYSPVFGMVKVG